MFTKVRIDRVKLLVILGFFDTAKADKSTENHFKTGRRYQDALADIPSSQSLCANAVC